LFNLTMEITCNLRCLGVGTGTGYGIFRKTNVQVWV
jgi:hypothetical protein